MAQSGQLVLSYKDYAGQNTRVRFHGAVLSAGNIAAQISASDALSAAILGVQNENALQTKRLGNENFITRAKATDPESQAGSKWLLILEDATLHTLFRNEIPLADASLLSSNGNFLDLSAGVGQALKTAVEAYVLSPAGNAVLLASAEFVGKRI